MKPEITPEKITAFLLGELQGDEANAVRSHLSENPQLDTKKVGFMANELRSAFAKEEIPQGSGAQKIFQKIPGKRYSPLPFRLAFSPTALSICLVLVLGLQYRKSFVTALNRVFGELDNSTEAVISDEANEGIRIRDTSAPMSPKEFLAFLQSTSWKKLDYDGCAFQVPEITLGRSQANLGNGQELRYEKPGQNGPVSLTIRISAAKSNTAEAISSGGFAVSKSVIQANRSCHAIVLLENGQEPIYLQNLKGDLEKIAMRVLGNPQNLHPTK